MQSQPVMFPPILAVGSRVWSEGGYPQHGPLEGPKIDIAPNVGGTIVGTEKPYYTIDQLLYTVRWDDGQYSKHYPGQLLCIGRFTKLSEFESAVKIKGPVHVTAGPLGGFREAQIGLEYDGVEIQAIVVDRRFWLTFLEPVVKRTDIPIEVTRLPGTPRRKRKPK